MPRSECRGRVAVTYSLDVCCNQTGDRYAARCYERARFYREVTATRLAGLFTQSRERWVGAVQAYRERCAALAFAPHEFCIPTYLVRRGSLMIKPTILHTHLVRGGYRAERQAHPLSLVRLPLCLTVFILQ